MHDGVKTSSRTRKIKGVALGLALLIAHAAVVSVVHHHAAASSSAAGRPVISAAGNSDDSPLSNGDSQCLSCSLQRNIVSEAKPAPILVEIVLHSGHSGSVYSATASKGTILVLSNRAPPLA